MKRQAWFWAALILAGLVAIGATRLRLDVDVLNLLPGDLPAVEGLKLYQQNFTDSRELIITLRAPDADRAEDAAKALAEALRDETNLAASVIWQPGWLERPAQAAELLGYLWLNQPPEKFDQLARRMTGTNIVATLADAREQYSSAVSPSGFMRDRDPFDLLGVLQNAGGGAGASFGGGQDIFESSDGRFRVLFVKAASDVSNYRTGNAWMDRVKGVIAAVRARNAIAPDVTIGLTGAPAFAAEISSGMQHDMTASVLITSVIIAVLFWLFHRRWVPMLWLLTLLAVILACTVSLGGLVFGAINVVSLGFAGILLGLAVDYGVVHYQEALASPNATIPEIRRAIGPSIFWAAVTTISAFLVLNFGGLPGLAQLGSLVALGVTLSALVMLFAFLPPLFRDRLRQRAAISPAARKPEEQPDTISSVRAQAVLAGTLLVILGSAIILHSGVPGMDHTGNALRPINSMAYSALEELQTNLTHSRDSIWLIARGHDETEVARRLQAAQPILERAVSNHVIEKFTLPTPLWPQPDHQSANRAAAAKLVAGRGTLRVAVLQSGFNTNALPMTDAVLDVWQAALAQPGVFWPTNELSQWILGRFAAHRPGESLAVGLISSTTNSPTGGATFKNLSGELAREGFLLSGWELLGPSILQRVQDNLWLVLLPMVLLVLLSLWLAFRRAAEILLSLAVLAVSGLCLLAVMRLAGWSWNLLNLMALPLMLGSGVDYSIFMQLALRRHHGNLRAAHHSVGRALLLCGGTAVAGFGSLALSNNAGMASLGKVCAIGIGSNMLISVLLLPVWWRKLAGAKIEAPKAPTPSSSYRPEVWRLGLFATRNCPAWACSAFARLAAIGYWTFVRHRREIVINNFLPAVGGDRAAAEQKGRAMLRQFTRKVTHLLRYESGLPIDQFFGEWHGWDNFEKARAKGRGILLLTPHLGNWEFGGPLLTQRGISLQVVTLAEPGAGFTELRQASRARWDIETLVVGDDPFAFVEIIRRLEAGATVAILVDRPQATGQVMVELFGQPFAASIAAAELARASGCVLLPVCLPLTERGYTAHVLPEIDYDRATLRQREARQQLTQKIITAFEAPIREHLDQWYHFVPVWPDQPPPVS